MAEPAHKKAKVVKQAAGDAHLIQLAPVQVYKVKADLNAEPSPGYIHACRAAVQACNDSCTAYVASAQKVYAVHVPLSSEGEVLTGKEGVVIPHNFQDVSTRCAGLPAAHSEIQSLTSLQTDGNCWLAYSDQHARGCISKLAADGVTLQAETNIVLQAPVHAREGSGSHLTMMQHDSDTLQTAITHHLDRTVHVYHNDRCIRTMHTIQCPTAVAWLPLNMNQERLLAVAEEHQVSIYDVRQAEKTGCVQRFAGAANGQSVHCLRWCSAGFLGLAGSERSVVLMDPRKWQTFHKWSGCAKYTINQLAFSSINPYYCYLAGLDTECIGGRWDGSSTGPASGNSNSNTGGHGRACGPSAFQLDAEEPLAKAGKAVAFRGDSRWLGMAKDAQRDVLVAYAQSGSLYIINMAGSKRLAP